MTKTHVIQKTAAAYAVRHLFRLRRNDRGTYTLVDRIGADVDCPATGETTAAGALRMMRRHIRLGRTDARALPISIVQYDPADLETIGPVTITETGEENTYFTLADGSRGFVKIDGFEIVEPGGYCLLCRKSFETGAAWDSHAPACMDLASE